MATKGAPVQTLDLEGSAASAFSLREDLDAYQMDWHVHGRHQLLYAATGTLHLQVAGATWLLPPQRAAWIGAGVSHRVESHGPVALRTVYLSPKLCQGPGEPCRVFSMSPLGREMVLYAMRWGPDRDPRDRVAERFFAALGALCDEWAREAQPFRLPTAQSPALQKAMEYAIAHLSQPLSMADAARAAGLSERTLARRFAAEANSTWREFVHGARMLRAMELLSVPGTQVTETAGAVGFESLGAFTRAFEEFVGERPRDYRRRATR